PHRLLSNVARQAIQVKLAVEVVNLVLNQPGPDLFALDDHRLAVEVRALSLRVQRALARIPEPRNGEATFVAQLLEFVRDLDDHGVEDVANLVVNVPGERS